MKDAIGNEIVVGKRYGYTTNSNGYSYSKVGIVEQIHPSGVTLKIIASWSSLYDKEMEAVPIEKKRISIRGKMLIPVTGFMTEKEKEIKERLDKIFEEESNGEKVEDVTFDGDRLEFMVYERSYDASFPCSLWWEGQRIRRDIHEIWEGSDVDSRIEELFLEIAERRPGGGTGIRDRLKPCRSRDHVGSSPTLDT